jgi:hypothetical protein
MALPVRPPSPRAHIKPRSRGHTFEGGNRAVVREPQNRRVEIVIQ